VKEGEYEVTVAYVIAIVGGIIPLAMSTLNVAWFGSSAPNWGGYGDYMWGAMDGYHDSTDNFAA
jgi:hypothetical protein